MSDPLPLRRLAAHLIRHNRTTPDPQTATTCLMVQAMLVWLAKREAAQRGESLGYLEMQDSVTGRTD